MSHGPSLASQTACCLLLSSTIFSEFLMSFWQAGDQPRPTALIIKITNLLQQLRHCSVEKTLNLTFYLTPLQRDVQDLVQRLHNRKFSAIY